MTPTDLDKYRVGQKQSCTNTKHNKHKVGKTPGAKKHKVGKTLTKWNKVGQTMLMVGSGTNIE